MLGMDFVTDVVSYGDAAIISVDGISSIERISVNKLRVSYFVLLRQTGGALERKIVLQVDWDISVWLQNCPIYKAVEPMAIGAYEPDIRIDPRHH